MDVHEADGDNTVVTGIPFFTGVMTTTLFDSGASHSFISKKHARKVKGVRFELDNNLAIGTPFGHASRIECGIKDCVLQLVSKKLNLDLPIAE
ncbi:UNVERIFIED_CONTAM: hypothetical protein ITH36_24990, partial [Salmonella enterica subsp. enterica serovar Weltevreden]